MVKFSRREISLLAGLALSSGLTGWANAAKGKSSSLKLDHLLWAVPDLETGRRDFEALTGVKPVYGGPNPGRTINHNSLVSLGHGTYLEIISPREANTKSALLRAAVADGQARLASFALRANGELPAIHRQLPDAGLTSPGPTSSGRAKPDGSRVDWQTLFVGGSTVDESLPFFIDWLGSKPHPSEDSPQGIILERFEIQHPDDAAVRRIFDVLAIDVPVVRAEKQALVARLSTPKGPVTLRT